MAAAAAPAARGDATLEPAEAPRLAVAWLTGAALFRGTIAASTAVMTKCRISSANQVFSTLLGGASVAGGGALAATAFNAVASGTGALLPAEAAAAMAVAAACGFRACGGAFRMLAPADVCRVGAFAHAGGVPASERYAGQAARRRMQALGRRHGCHQCGARSRGLLWRRRFVADHQPPLKYAGARTQRFYPQCAACAARQALAVRTDVRVLVPPATWRIYHVWLPWPLLLVGAPTLARAVAAVAS